MLQCRVVELLRPAGEPVACRPAIIRRSRSISATAARRISCKVGGSSGSSAGSVNTPAG